MKSLFHQEQFKTASKEFSSSLIVSDKNIVADFSLKKLGDVV